MGSVVVQLFAHRLMPFLPVHDAFTISGCYLAPITRLSKLRAEAPDFENSLLVLAQPLNDSDGVVEVRLRIAQGLDGRL